MRRILKHPWTTTWFCTRCVATVILWTVWLALAVLLAFQLTIAASRELAVPAWGRLRIEQHLGQLGLRARLGPTKLDTSGRILASDVTLLHPTLDEPLLDAPTVYVSFDPRWLAAGRLKVLEVEMEGVTLWLPSLHSPTGRREAALKDVAVTVHPHGAEWEIARLSARLGSLELTSRGRLKPPPLPPGARRQTLREQWAAGVRGYLRGVQRAYASLEWIDRFTAPRLHVELTPKDGALASGDMEFTASHVILPDAWSHKLKADVTVRGLVMRTTLPIGGHGVTPLEVKAAIAHLMTADERSADDIDIALAATFDPASFQVTPRELKLRAGAVSYRPWAARALSVETPLPALRPTLIASIAGEAWTLGVRALAPDAGKASVSLDGRLSPLLLEWAGTLAKRSFSRDLTLLSTPRLTAEIELDGGWKLQGAKGSLTADAVVARRVALDHASATFEFAGNALAFDDIVLKQGDSLARGSYRMDTASRDFRFLLDGKLQPAGINGWFRDWWPKFWENFDFSQSTPTASVDIQGRWGRNTDLTVFVAAENTRTALRGVWFDRARARLFVRPYFYEALHFHVNQGERFAHGSFARKLDVESRAWAEMDFDAFSSLDLADGARVIGIEGLGIVEPFHFSQPPQLRLTGHLEGPGSSRGQHRDVSIAFYAAGPCSYYAFPLNDISLSGTLKDDDIILDPFTTGFAQGTAEGRVHLNGEGADRRLGFDLRLNNAGLGEAIRTLEEFGAKRSNRELPQESGLQERIAAGRVDLAMSADGMFENLLSYQGQGNAHLTGADLGEINLFGVLSQVLKRTLFNFSTLKLDTVQANFTVQGPKLNFSEIRVSGPRAAIDARGDYLLDRKALDMKAKLYPFEESNFILSSAVGFVLTPLSEALEFKLTGQLDKPDWRFVYGPSSFFRALRGGEAKKPQSEGPRLSPFK